MSYWTTERIMWYQRAIEYLGFDRLLADALEPYLTSCRTVCDLACGTGYLAMELSRRGYDVTAVDRCETAIGYLRGEAARRGLSERMEILCADWTSLADYRWDCVVMSMAGGCPGELSYFLSLCRRKLVLAVRTDGKDPRTIPLEATLQECGYRWKSTPFSGDFGQPFTSEEDFRAYLRYYQSSEKLQESLRRNTTNGNYPLYLPLQRNLMLYEIEANAAGTAVPRSTKPHHTLIVGSSGTDRAGFLTALLAQAGTTLPVYGYHTVKEPPEADGRAPIRFYPVPGERIRTNENLVGWCKDRHAEVYPESFDRWARLLEDAPGHSVLLLDELGPMESASQRFCAAALRLMDGDTPVLAAVRDNDTPFLNAVRTHPKAKCFFLRPDNRDQVFQEALLFFREQTAEIPACEIHKM